MPEDFRTKKLAALVVNYSLRIKPKENVVIAGSTEATDFITALYKKILLRGAYPIPFINLPGLNPFFYQNAARHQLEKYPDYFDYLIKHAQKYIGINTYFNTRELSGCDLNKIALRRKVVQPISNYIVNRKDKIRRCTVGFPCVALAQEAEMSLGDYENFVFEACLQDWKKNTQNINKLLSLFQKGKSVQLIGDGVDLKFKIRGKQAAADRGEENMPGGEIFMAPEKYTVEGWIKFDYPAIEAGNEVSGIYLEFKQGLVVKSTADKNEEFLKQMLSADKNASYLGEFGIGCNPHINRFTKNLLFDEKINGTIHLALGMAYKENGGGNNSAIHWDIVKSMRRAKIILDGRILQENGRFVRLRHEKTLARPAVASRA